MEKNKKVEIYKNLILDVPGVKTAKFEKSIESSVTTSWGVNWDADFIARDILQNFRDSNLSEIEKVVVNTKNDRILVEGNNCFDLRKLFFVGSNKAGDETTVGEYGEGFKAAVVSMLKRGIQAPVSVSGDTAVVIDVGEEVVEEWFGWRPMIYHGIPIIDTSPRMDNVLVATGHNMLGLSMGPATGKLVSELLSGQPPHVSADPYRLFHSK